MAHHKPYVRARSPEYSGYLKDKKLKLNNEEPLHKHSEGLKPYAAKAAGANFPSMEDLHKSNFGPYAGWGGPGVKVDECKGPALLDAEAPPGFVVCGTDAIVLKATGHNRGGGAFNSIHWGFAFPGLSPLGEISLFDGSWYYEPPTCEALREDTGFCFDTTETLEAIVTLCDGKEVTSTTIIDIKHAQIGEFIILGPDQAQPGSQYEVGPVAVNLGDIIWTISSGSIDGLTGIILTQTCGSATITATSVCGEAATKVIRWANDPGVHDSIWALQTNCSNLPPGSGGCESNYFGNNRGTVTEGEWRAQIKDRWCNSASAGDCNCADDSISGLPCTDRPHEAKVACGSIMGLCPKPAAEILEWKWCCATGC